VCPRLRWWLACGRKLYCFQSGQVRSVQALRCCCDGQTARSPAKRALEGTRGFDQTPSISIVVRSGYSCFPICQWRLFQTFQLSLAPSTCSPIPPRPCQHHTRAMASPNPDQKQKRSATGYAFWPYALSRDLPFPSHASLTAYELIAFLPNSIRCSDVVYRFASNGASRHVLWVMINTGRDFLKAWTADQCGSTMSKTMSKAGYVGWTLTKHNDWHANRTSEWDETALTTNNFQTTDDERVQCEFNAVPFKDLAKGVRNRPEGSDALDLTRMVEYAVKFPEEMWMYPRDYEKMLGMLGGSAFIKREHCDRASFTRWEVRIPAPHRLWSDDEIATAKALEGKEKKRTRAESARKGTMASGKEPREMTPTAEHHLKTRGRSTKRTRFEDLDLGGEEDGAGHEERTQLEQYNRAPAGYAAAPEEPAVPSAATVNLAFQAEGNVGETEPFSPYSFGGPRRRAPYRMLHDLEPPDPADVSGWAENLRWAFEQRACFWHTVQTEGWSESPAHMEVIAQTRLKQIWASDELLAQLAEDGGDSFAWSKFTQGGVR
jgi:hypothetical protein